jgi:hypothetical protein
MEMLVAVLVFAGTSMQFLLKLVDLRENVLKREALRWSVAEDELAAEYRPWKRRAVRRQLRDIRTPEIDFQIRLVNSR